MSIRTIGLLVMDYGTPASLDDVEAYYTHIRRGNPPTTEKLQELKDRYAAIGGVSPLTERTRAQINGLEQVLNKQNDHIQFKAYSGKKHVYPFIADAVEQMVVDGIEEAVGIVLAPHYSTMSVGTYNKYAYEAAEKFGLKKLTLVNQWHLEPEFIDALVSRMKEALSKFPEVSSNEINVLFTAHSLPQRILQMNDPYPEQLLETSRAIADKFGITNWDFAWQSAGQTADPWLGPDILEVLPTLQEQDVRAVVISPIGFVSDHLEVLYDIDIEAQSMAKELGIHLERTESLNDDPQFLRALANVVLANLPKEH